jgi:hypothetical protein
VFVDADGVSTEAELLARWHDVELLERPAVQPSDVDCLLESETPGGWNSALLREDSEVVAGELTALSGWSELAFR